MIVHGRDDALIPVNHSSRPYYAVNRQIEGRRSKLRYYEVKKAQHLDSLNQLYTLVGMNYVPIDYYFKQALDLMHAHLTEKKAMPPSQVVQATAPQGALSMSDLPDISFTPDARITYRKKVLIVPE